MTTLNPLVKPATTETTADKSESKSYQFPSAPSNYVDQRGVRHTVPDGILTTSDPQLIEELEAAVDAECIWHAEDVVFEGEKPAALVPPKQISLTQPN